MTAVVKIVVAALGAVASYFANRKRRKADKKREKETCDE